MYTGHPPFVKADPKTDAYYRSLCNNKHEAFWNAHSKNKPGKNEFFSKELRHLFNSLFALDSNSRITIQEILNHPWI